MRPLTNQEIEAYLKKDQPFDCAGSYKIEERGIKLFSQIVGEDKEAIMGVPLMKLQTHLLNLGFPLF
jgi:septum formation protein